MTKLKKYSTLSDWDSAVGGGSLEYPSVGLVEEDGNSVYLRSPIKGELGDIVFFDYKNKGFVAMNKDLVTSANPNYTPIGVVAIPWHHNIYGNNTCGVVSLVDMSVITPDTGSNLLGDDTKIK